MAPSSPRRHSSAESLKLDRQLCFPLYAATRAMMRAYQPLLSRIGVTYPQYLVLLVLWEGDGLSVTALGDRLYLDSGTLTPLLKRLERQGLVHRTRSIDDERVVEIALTSEGKKLRQKALSIPEALFCKLDVRVEEFVRLRDDLRRLYALLRHVADQDTARKEAS